MYTPTATYRFQLSASFTLEQLSETIDYLRALGVSTVYASPIFQARAGSTHGYDVSDPLRLNAEIGTETQLANIARRLKELDMGWLQDIVPNHMAYDPINPWVHDLLEKGPHTKHAAYFDVDWNHPDPRFRGKIIAPFLGSPLESVLQEGQLSLHWGETGFQLWYYDHHLPVSVASYTGLLRAIRQSASLSAEQQSLLDTLAGRAEAYARALPSGESTDDAWNTLMTDLHAAGQQHPALAEAMAQFAASYAQDTDRLQALLEEQHYRLVHWKTTERVINYRRFFTVNDLICLNAHRPEVFSHYHQKIKQWVDQGLMQGLRVDHVDGLLDPTGYLRKLRSLVGEDSYIVVEKILEHDEQLPEEWPVQGSSGYAFLADVNQLFTSVAGARSLLSYYTTWNSEDTDYQELVYQNKHFILRERMQGELDNLTRLLESLHLAEGRSFKEHQEALAQLLVAFPVYRIYSTSFPFTAEDQAVLDKTFERALAEAPELADSLEALRPVFRGQASGDEDYDARRLDFVMRCQQFSGPLAAKGVEDTTFYGYHALISHNEVGDSPEQLGLEAKAFHRRMQQRWPLAMNATATHDTKRGEDARLRISVLSEVPSEWMKMTARWRYNNEPYKTALDQEGGWPEANFEYFIYQTLLGTYPFHTDPEAVDYPTRLRDYLVKAAREAKGNTSWSDPNEDYEQAVDRFVVQLLQDETFMEEFTRFAEQLARTAVNYSLGQTLLKITAPGIPDVYQGTEFWDLSMVDPDNRRPVDYAQRREALSRFESAADIESRTALLRQLINNVLDPAIKLYVLSRSLRVRRQLADLFSNGTYEPLVVRGVKQRHLLAFRRVWEAQEAVVLVPLGVASLSLTKHLPLGKTCWGDTQVVLPTGHASWTNAFTEQTVSLTDHGSVAEALDQFPVALLTKN
jgi:(1->4)-alpha-D-glucan 1-alpha-D-glucosylmutase